MRIFKGCTLIGCAASAVSVMVYDFSIRTLTAMTAVGLTLAAGIAVSALCAAVYDEEEYKRRRKWLKRHDKRIIKDFQIDTLKDYLVIPRRRKTLDEEDNFFKVDEELEKPIRKVCGALAEDFAKLPEDERRAFFA